MSDINVVVKNSVDTIKVAVKDAVETINVKLKIGIKGDAGAGVPTGGTTGQVLSKVSNSDYDTEWVDQSVGGGAVDSVNGQTGTVVLDAADVGAEPALGFTPENVANKVTNLSSPDDTKYPTTKAVSDAISASTQGANIFMLARDASGVATYFNLKPLSGFVAGVLQTASQVASTSPTLLASFATEVGQPNITALPIGLFSAHWEVQKSAGSNNYFTFFEVYKRSSGGTETLLLTSDNSSVTAANTIQSVNLTAFNPDIISLLATDRIVLKVYAQMQGSTATITLRWDDNTDARLQLPSSPLFYVPENVANKSQNTSLGVSNTLYPTQNAVKSYVDAGLSGKQNALGYTPANESLSNLDITSINQDLIPDGDTNRSLGDKPKNWANIYAAVIKFGNDEQLIDVANRLVKYNNGETLLDIENGQIKDNLNTQVMNIIDRSLIDSSERKSIGFEDRTLFDNSEAPSLDYRGRSLITTTGSSSIDWEARSAIDSSGNKSIDWEARKLLDDSELESVDFLGRNLTSPSGVNILDWSQNTGATVPDQAANDNSGKIANTKYVDTALALKPNSIQTDTFTTSGTWTKPAGAKRVRGICVSGSGGSGSGRRGAAGTVRCGGGSGVSGYYVLFDLDASILPSTVSVTVGAAGVGGASVLTDDTNGNNGTSGGSSSFGTYARTTTCAGGLGGTNSTGAGGTAQATTVSPMASRQVTGIAASTTGGNGTAGVGITTLEGTSGGSGAGITVGNNPQQGGAGGGYTFASPFGTVSGGAAGTTAGTNGGDGNLTDYYLFGLRVGTSGGGGGTVGSGTISGNGGNAGGYLGSGGGGAASTNGTPSGKGGDGFPGAVVVITEF